MTPESLLTDAEKNEDNNKNIGQQLDIQATSEPQSSTGTEGQSPTTGSSSDEVDAVNRYVQSSENSQLPYLRNNLSETSVEINSINNQINEKRQRLMRQEAEIMQKKKIILTRNRMLNISDANNRYNQKLIYTFVSIIFGLFIIVLVLYTYNNKNYIQKTNILNSVANNSGNNS